MSVPPGADPYRRFLETRWASRARLLCRYGLGAAALILVFDLLARAAGAALPLGAILAWRAPAFLVPGLGLVLIRPGSQARALPVFTVAASAAWAWLNAAAFLGLGMGDTAFHVLVMVVAFICTAAFLPVERRGRLLLWFLLGTGQAVLDLAWPDARPLRERLFTQGLLLVFGASTGLLFEDLSQSKRRAFLLRAELESTVDALEASRGRMAETAVAVASTAEQLGRSAGGLVERVEATSREGEAVAATVERLADAARALRDRSRDSAAAATETSEHATSMGGLIGQIEAGVREVEAAVELSEKSFGGLERRAASIHTLVETTRDVAVQTHMLAVNAGIQAVSAGEHGKGFAVIAEAIRELSRDSAKSAQAIAHVVDDVSREMASVLKAITEVRARTGQLATAFDESRAMLERVRAAVAGLGDAMAANANDAGAQATSTAGVSDAAGRIAALLRDQAETAAEVARSSTALAGHATGLRTLLPAEGAARSPIPRDT